MRHPPFILHSSILNRIFKRQASKVSIKDLVYDAAMLSIRLPMFIKYFVLVDAHLGIVGTDDIGDLAW